MRESVEGSVEALNSEVTEQRKPVEVRVKGRWVSVPVLEVNCDQLTTRGKWLKIARIRGEEMREEELENPEVYLSALKDDKEGVLKADIFSFAQKPPASHPKYSYPMEWESTAAICLVSAKQWWEGLPQESRKNVRRSQKRGVVIRVEEFGDK